MANEYACARCGATITKSNPTRTCKACRFWSRVDKNGPTPPHVPHLGQCWVWTGRKTPKGYGAIRFPGAQTAHRAAWILAHGSIPEGAGYHGTCVLHRCDNPACVRLSHLRLGTQRENIDDAVAKRRMASGERSGARLHPEAWTVGEKSACAKLTTADVLAIRAAIAAGETGRVVAERFGITKPQVFRIANRLRWKHVA